MKGILNFVWEYRFIIMAIVWVGTYAVMDFEKFKSNVKSAMLAAKQMSKEQILKNGYQQQEWVVNFVYNKLSKNWANILGEKRTRDLIQKLYSSSLDLMDDGKLNNSL